MLVGHWRKEEERQSGRSKTKKKEGRNKEIMNKSTYNEMQITWARSWSQSCSFCHAGRESRKEQCTWFRVNPVLGCPGWEAPCAVTNVLICTWRNLEPQEKWCLTPPRPRKSYARHTDLNTPRGSPESLWCSQTGSRKCSLPSLHFLYFVFLSSIPCPCSLLPGSVFRLPRAWQQPQIHFNIKETEHLRGENWISVCLASCWMILDFNLSQ